MRGISLGIALLGLAACTPADQQYCNQFGVGGTAEYGNCLSYYRTQEAAFNADRAVCDSEADGTYPRTLYDRGSYQRIYYGGGGWGGPRHGWRGGPWNGYGGGAQTVFVEPDYYHNAQVDGLRMRIVEPCMQSRGWNSGETWQAGRHTASRKARSGGSSGKLPWLR